MSNFLPRRLSIPQLSLHWVLVQFSTLHSTVFSEIIDWGITSYNHPERGDYDTGALFLKWRFSLLVCLFVSTVLEGQQRNYDKKQNKNKKTNKIRKYSCFELSHLQLTCKNDMPQAKRSSSKILRDFVLGINQQYSVCLRQEMNLIHVTGFHLSSVSGFSLPSV